MSMTHLRTICVIMVISVASFISGCGVVTHRPTSDSRMLAPAKDLGETVGTFAKAVLPRPIPVQGYGLVGGLAGTGSAECPELIKAYLTRYILIQLPDREVDIDKLISSENTAVVAVEGVVSAETSGKPKFDVKVTALASTQTASLENGWLYRTELWPRGAAGITARVIAHAEGPIYIDKIDTLNSDTKTGYVLGGGQARDEPKINLILRKPDYKITSRIRNRLNEHFGYGTARAISPVQIELDVPDKYRGGRLRFMDVVEATYLDPAPELTAERVKALIMGLAVSDNKDASEFGLEAMGAASLSKLGVLLNSSNEQVRFRAARCMLNLGSDRGLQALREMALDRNSNLRIEALEAIGESAKRDDIAAISQRLLRDSSFQIRLAAYEQLRELDDVAVMKQFIGRSFFLEQVVQTEYKAIYVSRSGPQRIVLFGAPMYCRDNFFVESVDGNIIIDSRASQKYVSVARRHPTRPAVIGPYRCSFKLSDIIQLLCDEPIREDKQRGGFGVSYGDMIALLKRMCDEGAVQAGFYAGPLPEKSFNIKK